MGVTMNELKTLKEIDNSEIICDCNKVNHYLYLDEDLREEAIKNIKELKIISKKECKSEACFPHDRCEVCTESYEAQIKIDWIKHFFNITEGDFEGYPKVVDKQDKIKELFNELDLEEQRSLVNEISDCIEVEERKHCD